MSDTPTPRPAPVLRKEVVTTSTWGDLVVRQVMASCLVGWSAGQEDAEDGETDAQRTRRTARNNVRWCNELMAVAVIAQDGEPMYSPDDWDAWSAIAGAESLKLLNAALRINGFKTLGDGGGDEGEDAAKNG